MKPSNRKEAIQAYKERLETGAVFRYIHKAEGWQGPLLMTPNLQGKINMLSFSKKTNSCPESSLSAQWNRFAVDGFELHVVETLDRKPEQTSADFRDELDTLLALWQAQDASKPAT